MPHDPRSSSSGRTRACLVIGGARSGKSAFAQTLAERSGLAPVYLATATVWDDEMAARVRLHQGARDARWRTLEEPLCLAEAITREAGAGSIVLVDCLTLWLTNLVLGRHPVEDYVRALVAAIAALSGPAIIVTNEVGQGIVPDNALAREFRDRQGRLNQAVAHACDAVVLVTAGLPLQVKPAPSPSVVFAP